MRCIINIIYPVVSAEKYNEKFDEKFPNNWTFVTKAFTEATSQKSQLNYPELL